MRHRQGRGLCLTSHYACVTVNITTAVKQLTVIFSLILRPGPADGQSVRVPVRAGELVRDALVSVVITIDKLQGVLDHLWWYY